MKEGDPPVAPVYAQKLAAQGYRIIKATFLPFVSRNIPKKKRWELSRILLAADDLDVSCGGKERSQGRADLVARIAGVWEDKSKCMERLQHAACSMLLDS